MKNSRLAIVMLASFMSLVACGGSTPEQSITINQKTASVQVGQTVTLVPTAPEGVTLEWSSSNPAVATVANGVVTGVKTGQSTIKVTITGTTVSASCVVTVLSADGKLIDTPTEILIQTTFNDTYGQIFLDAAARLMEKEPNITVNYNKYSGSYTALKDEIVKGVPADNYPDIAVAYPDSVADFIDSDVALNMDPYMDNSVYGWTAEEKADFYEAYLAEGQNYSVEGTLSLPIAKSTEAMYYDHDKLIGLSLASIDPTINGGKALSEEYINSLTWDELFDKLCPAILQYRETLPEAERKAFLDTETYTDWAIVGYDSDDNLFITLAEQYGYGYTDMDVELGVGKIEFVNDGMKNLMKKFNGAYNKHYFTTKGIIGTNVNYRSTVDAMLFSIGSTGGVNYQFSANNPKNMAVARIPQAPNQTAKVIQQGPSLAFLDHKDQNRALASWLFYKELTSVNSCIAWATTTGYAPIRKSVSESDDYLDYSDETKFQEKTADHLKALNSQYVVEASNFFFSSPVFKGSSEARTQVGGLATKAIGEANLTDELLNNLFQEAYSNTILKM